MRKKLLVCLVVLGLSGHVFAGLVGYWPLNGDGTDLSDYGNHGAVNGKVAPVMDKFGDPNGAMSFAGGGGDNINPGNRPEFDLTGAMTIAAWVYLDGTSSLHGARNGRIVGKMSGGGNRAWSTGIEKTVSGVAVPATLQIAPDKNTVFSLSDDNPLPLNQWVHYAGVYTPEGSLAIYLDGALSAIRTDNIAAAQFSANGQPPLIGNRPGCTDCGWYGSLDEVRIYNEALSEAQIKAIMALDGVAAQRETNSPQPAHRATGVPFASATLSWKPGVDLADPSKPNPAITGYYLWLSPPYDPASPPNMRGWWSDPGVKTIFVAADKSPADGKVDETTSYTVTGLQTDALYYWAVDASLGAKDENDFDKLILGNVWSFRSVTASPVVDAGADSVAWLKAGAATVDLNATVTDATGDLTTLLWSVVTAPPDAAVAFADASRAVTTAALTAVGQYVLELHATDAAQHEDSDQVRITVYNDSCEAAKAVPGYTPIPGDLNGDCRVDDLDMGILQEHWLECNALDCSD